jgi:hypothetical protein
MNSKNVKNYNSKFEEALKIEARLFDGFDFIIRSF